MSKLVVPDGLVNNLKQGWSKVFETMPKEDYEAIEAVIEQASKDSIFRKEFIDVLLDQAYKMNSSD